MLVVLGLIVVAAMAVWAGVVSSGTWRYRITVEIETPEGVKTGNAVHEVSNSASSVKILDLPEVGNPPEFRGEAVVIDLGKRGVLFAILPTNPYQMFYNTFPNPDGASTPEGINYYNRLKKGNRRALASKDYPMFVVFRDMSDPMSVQEVDPHNLAKTFGEGVNLQDIIIQITHDPATWQIEKYLSWLSTFSGYLHGGNTSRGAPLGLYGGHFKRLK